MKKRAFTLIELLIVLVIIGVLATLAMPQYEKLIVNMKGAEAKKNLSTLSDSAWRYYLEAGDFAAGLPEDQPPPELDVNLPLTTEGSIYFHTKYFFYFYSRHKDGDQKTIAVFLQAVLVGYNEAPVGVVGAYDIRYFHDTHPQFPTDQSGVKMDEHWYKFYYHQLKTSSTPEVKPGWP